MPLRCLSLTGGACGSPRAPSQASFSFCQPDGVQSLAWQFTCKVHGAFFKKKSQSGSPSPTRGTMTSHVSDIQLNCPSQPKAHSRNRIERPGDSGNKDMQPTTVPTTTGNSFLDVQATGIPDIDRTGPTSQHCKQSSDYKLLLPPKGV